MHVYFLVWLLSGFGWVFMHVLFAWPFFLQVDCMCSSSVLVNQLSWVFQFGAWNRAVYYCIFHVVSACRKIRFAQASTSVVVFQWPSVMASHAGSVLIQEERLDFIFVHNEQRLQSWRYRGWNLSTRSRIAIQTSFQGTGRTWREADPHPQETLTVTRQWDTGIVVKQKNYCRDGSSITTVFTTKCLKLPKVAVVIAQSSSQEVVLREYNAEDCCHLEYYTNSEVENEECNKRIWGQKSLGGVNFGHRIRSEVHIYVWESEMIIALPPYMSVERCSNFWVFHISECNAKKLDVPSC